MKWEREGTLHVRGNGEAIIYIPTAGPPIPSSQMIPQGTLMEEAHSGPNTNPLSHKRTLEKWEVSMAKGHPEGGGHSQLPV